MPWGPASILLALLALMLLAACWYDLKSRTIPNELCIAAALLAIPFWWASGLALWPDVAEWAGGGNDDGPGGGDFRH